MNNKCIQVCNVSKIIDNNVILDNISVDFFSNKITSIIGENGCGKSTLLSLLSRQSKVSDGSIMLYSKELNNYSIKEIARKISIVNQVNILDSDITVYQFVQYARIPYKSLFSKLSENDIEKINFALEVCDLIDLKEQSLDTLSGGQKQRVFIALAIAKDCSLLLLDEPTTYMDIKHQMSLLKLIKKLNIDFGLTVIMVLHDINQAINYSDYIIGMKKGHIIYDGASGLLNCDHLEEIYETDFVIEKIRNNNYVIYNDSK